MSTTDFDKIFLNQSKHVGRLRIADSGLGWRMHGSKSVPNAKTFLLPSEELLTCQWSRGSKGWELRVQTRNQGVIMLDGFDQEDFAKVKQELSRNFNVPLEHREHSLRGWNWGKTDFTKNEVVFQVSNKPAFEIPYKEITNSNLTGKTEVAIEFNLEGGDRAGDELVEMRFHIPGMVEIEEEIEDGENGENRKVKDEDKKVKAEDGDEEIKEESDDVKDGIDEEKLVEEVSAASLFYDELKDRARIGQVAGEAIVSFRDVLFLTPRGRYDIDMYPSLLRLRGKTYDYKIQYKQIERIFSLPKPDEVHHFLILQIDPPLRQGQTRYPFLIIQFAREEETNVELNVLDEEFEAKYKDRLKKSYDGTTSAVMAHCFKGLTERRLVIPGSFQSRFLQPGISCSLKASEGYLYPLDRCFLFVPKPTIYIPFSEISAVTLARAGGGMTASRTFDLDITLKNGQSYVFGSIDREEQDNVENYCQQKGLRVKNEDKIAKAMLAKVMKDEADDDDDEDVDMGSAGSDGSVDGDFQGDSDSDIAEEFDSNAESSEEDDDEPPKKKSKQDDSD